jgi:hypothetical protein
MRHGRGQLQIHRDRVKPRVDLCVALFRGH